MTVKEFYSIIEIAEKRRIPNIIDSVITPYTSNVLNKNVVILEYRHTIVALYDYKYMYIFKYKSHETARALEFYHRSRSALPYRPIYFYRRKDKTVDPNEGKPANYDSYAKFGFKFHVWLYLMPLIAKTSLNN